MTAIACAAIPTAPAHPLRRPFISGGAPLAWPVALGPLVVKMTTYDCRRGSLGQPLGIARLPTHLPPSKNENRGRL